MKFQTFREAHDAYLRITNAWPAGPDRDQAFLAMADVPVLAVDNHGHKHPVCIVEENGRLILYCVGAPSGWRLADLAGFFSDLIAFDLGQNWFCTNIDAVLRAVPLNIKEVVNV